MARRPRCVICGTRFLPDRRVGSRQKCCSAKCSREHHRRACEIWHCRERAARDRERLEAAVRRVVVVSPVAVSIGAAPETPREGPMVESRGAGGPPVVVVVGEIDVVKLRDELERQAKARVRKSAKEPAASPETRGRPNSAYDKGFSPRFPQGPRDEIPPLLRPS